MTGNFTVYFAFLSFFVYGFLGWCTEVAFAAFKERRFVNRGFLNGPICPNLWCGCYDGYLVSGSGAGESSDPVCGMGDSGNSAGRTDRICHG